MKYFIAYFFVLFPHIAYAHGEHEPVTTELVHGVSHAILHGKGVVLLIVSGVLGLWIVRRRMSQPEQ